MRPSKLKSYKGETFGCSSELIAKLMEDAIALDAPWVLFKQPNDKRERDIWEHGEWYNPDLSLRDTPSTQLLHTGLEDYIYDDVPETETTDGVEEPKPNAIDKLKQRKKT